MTCQQFGHGTNSCRSRLTCAKCGAHDHPSENCNSQHFMSINCQASHPAYSRTCEKYQLGKKIINNVEFSENTSFPEAQERVVSFPLGRYANAVRRGGGASSFGRKPDDRLPAHAPWRVASGSSTRHRTAGGTHCGGGGNQNRPVPLHYPPVHLRARRTAAAPSWPHCLCHPCAPGGGGPSKKPSQVSQVQGARSVGDSKDICR